jgi:hypothetical protein
MVKRTRYKKDTYSNGFENKTDLENNTTEANETRGSAVGDVDVESYSKPVNEKVPVLEEDPSPRKKKNLKAKINFKPVMETIPEELSQVPFPEVLFGEESIKEPEESMAEGFALGDFINKTPVLEDFILDLDENPEPLGISALKEIFEKEFFPVPVPDKEPGPEPLIEREHDPEGSEEGTDALEVLDVPAEEPENLSENLAVCDVPPEEKQESEKQEPEVVRAFKESTAHIGYDPMEFASIQAMGSVKGFAPLGMFFILMDVLNGKEEGLIRVNRLANALKIGKPAMLTQLDHLEQAGLIRTVSSSQRGRHVELLVPNLIAGRQPEGISRETQERSQTQVLNALPLDAPKNFTLEKLKALQKYLSDREIRLVSLPDESTLDPRLSQIAAFLGKYLAYVQPFYFRLKGTLNTAEEIHFSLLGSQGRDVTHTLNFCKMLKEVGFLEHFSYRRSPHYKIVARLKRTPAAINFLSGGWLEHHIRDKVVAILTTHPSTLEMPYAFMKNPKIILPGNENFEFDFLLMVGDKVFWIEAKTGEYMDYIAKYARVSKLLELNRNSSLLVLVDIPKPDANISARYGLSCCSVDEFPEVFRLALIRELGRSRS